MREEGTGRPRQWQHGPLGKMAGGGGQKPGKTLAGPLAFAVTLEESIPRPIHHKGWEPWQALRGGTHPVGPGLPSKGRSALPRRYSGGRWHQEARGVWQTELGSIPAQSLPGFQM